MNWVEEKNQNHLLHIAWINLTEANNAVDVAVVVVYIQNNEPTYFRRNIYTPNVE